MKTEACGPFLSPQMASNDNISFVFSDHKHYGRLLFAADTKLGDYEWMMGKYRTWSDGRLEWATDLYNIRKPSHELLTTSEPNIAAETGTYAQECWVAVRMQLSDTGLIDAVAVGLPPSHGIWIDMDDVPGDDYIMEETA